MPGKCIFIVEDELIVAENVRVMLMSFGYVAPTPATSTEEAMRMVESIHPDMVLIDIQLEGPMSGVYLARQIRERFDIPLIFLTAYADEETVRHALAAEPHGYLVKPFSAEELRTAIELAFFRHNLERRSTAREKRYRAIVDTSSDLVLRFQSDGTITFANAACSRLLDRAPESLLGTNFMSLIFSEDRAAVREQLGSLSRKKPFSIGDARVETGKPHPPRIWWQYTAVYDEQGTLAEIQAAGRDVTRRWHIENELRERNAWLEHLNQAHQAFVSSLELEQVLTHILETLRQQMDVVASSVWLIDAQTGELVCHYATEPGKTVVLGWRLAPGQGIAGWVASNGRSLIVPDVRRDPRHFRAVDEQTGLRIASMISVPLRVEDRVIGVLEVMDKTPHRFTEADLKHVELLATAASIAIQNAHLYREANHLRLFNQEIVQSMDEGIAVEDETGIITFANPRLARMLGCRVDDLVGRHWTDILAPEETAIISAERHRWPRTEISRYETVLMACNGERIPVMVSARSLFRKGVMGKDGLLDHHSGAQFVGTLSVFTDIRELKRSQQSLQRRLAAEKLLATVSTGLLDTPFEQLEQEIQRALEALGQFMEADQVTMLLIAEDGVTISGHQTWQPADISQSSICAIASLEELPWCKEKAHQGEPIVVTQATRLPTEATVERTFLQTAGIQSALWAPVLQEGRVTALLGIYALRYERAWTSEDARLAKLIGESVLNALARQRALRQLEVSLREKEALIREVQSRVNSNLQLVCSLLELQTAGLSDPTARQVCSETAARIRSIGLIYEALRRSGELDLVDAAEALPALAHQVCAAHPGVVESTTLHVHSDRVMLDMDTAVTLALLVNELFSHLLRNAFPPEWKISRQPSERPSISISLRHDASAGKFTLQLYHHGVSEWADTWWFTSPAFEAQLVRTLVTQLRGTFDVQAGDGATFTVTFPDLQSYKRGENSHWDRA